MHSTQHAAVEEGIVAGGGTALVNVIDSVTKLELTGDDETGRNIVLRALEEPVRQIAYNAGYEGSVIIDKLKNSELGTGFNANRRMGQHDGCRYH